MTATGPARRPLARPEELEALRGSDLFDAAWYAARHPDVALLGMDPAEHYLWLGHRLGRSPSPRFDGPAYLAVNDDVARTGTEPLLHYLRWGRAEGRWPVPVRRRTASRMPLSAARRAAARPRPTLNWVTNPDNVGWAYGNNARSLAAHMPGFEHHVDAFDRTTDAALYFDIRVFQSRGRSAGRNVLRVGGPRPLDLAYEGNQRRLAADLAAFDAVIVLNRALLHALAPLHPEVRLVPNALDLDAWAEAGVAARPDEGRPYTVGFAGDASTVAERALKGLDLVEAACASLGVRLLRAGKGEGQIPREAMPSRFYGAIDCLVHPVAPGKEGCSNVIMEALALGVPVVATREAGFHAELIADGEGLLYCTRDVASIAACIDRLRGDAGLRATMRGEGLRFARLHHDVRRTAPTYARLLAPEGRAAESPVVEFLPFWEPPERYASSRLRCAQPAAVMEGSVEVRPVLGAGAPSADADVIVVSQLASDATMAALARAPGTVAVYDVCDRYFDDDRVVGGVPARSRFLEMAARAEVVTVPTVALKREVAALELGKPVVHLPDGIDYREARDPSPTDPAGPVLWFGNPGRGNFESARWMIDRAMRRGRAVRIVSRRAHFTQLADSDPAYRAYAAVAADWEPGGFVAGLRACGLCLLAASPEEPAKSPNRLVTAVANGLPAIVAGMPAAAALLEAAGLGWAVVGDEAELDAAMDRLALPRERRRYLDRMQALVEGEFGDDAVRARFEAFARAHLAPGLRGRAAPRVLFVSSNLSMGEGAPTSLLQTVSGLRAAHRIEASVFALLAGPLVEAYASQGIPVVVPPPGPNGVRPAADRVETAFGRALREARPDVVVANTALALPFAGLAEAAGIPAIAVIRESSAEHADLAFGPPEAMDACREGLARTHRAVFVSEATRRLWLGRHDLPDAVVVPNGIDLRPFAAARAEPRAEARRALGVPDGDLLVLSVGSINPRKAQGDIVEAFGLLPRDLRGAVRLALVGATPSDYLAGLEARIARLDPGLAARVRIEPETPDVGRWYRAADIFAFASTNESYPRVVLEAMSFGLPVVSSAVFGTREQIVDGESGLLFRPGDVPGLARHLARLLSDAALRRTLGQAAEDRAGALVTYEEMVHRYAVLIRKVLDERTGGREDAARP